MTQAEITPSTAPLSDQALAMHLLEALRSPVYRLGREAMIAYETTEGRRSQVAVLDMRDALDHLVTAATTGDEGELKEACDHLRRAGVEPAQDMIESRLDNVRKGLRYYSLRRIVFPGLPKKTDVDQMLEEIKHHLKLGRLKKAQMDSAVVAIEHFVSGHATAVALDKAIHRPPLAWWFRLIFVFLIPYSLAVAGVVLGIIALR